MKQGSVFLAALAFSAASLAQTEETRTLDVDGGASVTYTLVSHPAGVHLARPAEELAPTSALSSSRLLNQHLASGDLVEAALLSNSPRRRFEVLRDYRESVGENEFKRVFAQYFVPENRLLAEIAIDRQRLLIWQLALDDKAGAPSRVAGQYFVEIEGRWFIDDVPNDVRTRLRWVLEAYRSGRIKF